jgi:hypothetical protein
MDVIQDSGEKNGSFDLCFEISFREKHLLEKI